MSDEHRAHGSTRGIPAADERGALRHALVALAAFVVAGVLAGALWPQLVDPVVVELTEMGLLTDEVSLGERFDTVGWYSLVGGGFGLVLGAVLTARGRAHEVVTVLSILAGAVLAAVLSAQLGTLLGPGDAEQALSGAAVGTTAEEQIELTTTAAYLSWPIAAMVGSAAVLWSRLGRRDAPGPAERTDPTDGLT